MGEKLSAVKVGYNAVGDLLGALAVVFALPLLLLLGCVTMSDLLHANNKVLAESAPISVARRVD